MKQRAERLLARFPDASLRVLVVGSALAIGAVHPVTGLAVAAVAAAFTLSTALQSQRTVRPPLLFWAVSLAGIWCFVQTLPLGGLVGALSPPSAELWALAPGDQASLSANVEATRLAGLRFLILALLFLGAIVWYRRSDRVRSLADLVIVSAAVVAVIGFVQSWLKSSSILFVYEPTMGPVRQGLHGPFVNPDHFGAYTAIGALVAISRGALLQISRRRFLDYAMGALLLVATLLSFSLSALTGLTLGLVYLSVVWWRRDRKVGDLLGVAVGLFVTAAFLALVATTVGIVPNPVEAVEQQLDAVPFMLGVWQETAKLGLEAPLVGVGSGSLPDLLGMRLDAPAVSVWFARNQPLQWLADLGLPVAVFLGLTAAFALRRIVTRWPADHLATMLPLTVGLVGLTAITLVDFALEIPAIGIVATLLLGAVVAQSRRLAPANEANERNALERLTRRTFSLRSGFLLGVSLVLSLVTIGVGASALLTSVRASAALEGLQTSVSSVDQVDEDSAERAETITRLAEERLSYRPGQGRVYTIVGRGLLLLQQPGEARSWLETAVTLRPNDWAALELLALVELREGRTERALVVLERAMAAEPERVEQILAFVVDETDDPAIWAGLTVDVDRRRLLVRELLARDRAVDALRFASALLADSDGAAGYEVGARAAFELGFDDLAAYYAQNLSRLEPASIRADVIQARVDLRRGNIESAAERIEAVLNASPDDYEAWFARGELLVRRAESAPRVPGTEREHPRLDEQMREVRRRLRSEALADPNRGGNFHRLSARFYLAVGNYRAAASAATHGIEAGGERAELHAIEGLSLYELRDFSGAASALRRAIELGSTDPRVVERWTQLAGGQATERE